MLERLKASPTTRATPVVVFTSSREVPDVGRCCRLGVNGYVVEPVGFDQFERALRPVGDYRASLNHPPRP